MRRIGFVRIVSNPTCFVALPSTWLSTGSIWQVRAAEKEGIPKFFVSTLPTRTANDEVNVEFGSEFASACELCDGDAVECAPWTGPVGSCDELTIVVDDEREYELVSLRNDFVEADLLSRLLIVAPRFPLWLGPDVASVVVIARTVQDSSALPVKIVDSTRLIVSSRGTSIPATGKDSNKRSLILRAHEEGLWSTFDVLVCGWVSHDVSPGAPAIVRKFTEKSEAAEKVRIFFLRQENTVVKYPHVRIPRHLFRSLGISNADAVELEILMDEFEDRDRLEPTVEPELLPKRINQFHLAIFDDICDFIIKWSSSNSLVGGFPPSVQLLLHGPRKSGKSSVVRQVCLHFVGPPFHIVSETVDLADFLDRRPEALDARLKTCVESLIWRRPAIIILENMDASDSTTSETENSSNHERLAQLCRDWSRLKGVLFIATSCSFESAKIYPFVKKLDVPSRLSSEERRSFFTHNIPSAEKWSMEKLVIATSGCSIAELSQCLNNARLAQSVSRSQLEHKLPNGSHLSFLECVEEAVVEIASRKATRLKKEDVAVGFDDVGGLEEPKKVLVEAFAWPAKYPRLFARCGLRMKRGVLLYGAPGSGKTLLGYAIAAEANLGLIRIKGPELLSKYIGQSESNVRDVFERAKAAAPCLLFFDEFDSLAPKRGHDSTGVSDRVVNQLLTALDGFEPLAEGVHVLAATSRPDLVDPALVRPGRFDRCVYCPFPDENARDAILGFLGSKVGVESSQGRDQVAAKTVGFSGADLSALIHNARLKVLAGQQRGAMPQNCLSWQDVEAELASTGPSLSSKVLAEYEAAFRRFRRPGDLSSNVAPSSRVSMA